MATEKKRYVEYLTVTLADGERKQLRFTSVKKKEAKAKRERALQEYQSGALVFNQKTTVAEYAQKWQDQMDLSADDRSRLKRNCLDLIGGMDITRVRATHIRDCYATVKGKSNSTISKTCGTIKRMFEAMCADGLIGRNPCTGVSRPSGETKARRAMNEVEESIFLSLLDERVRDGKHWYDIALGVTYACGLRPGEVRALPRSNIYLDVKEPFIRVTQACKHKTREIGPPKTKAGEREVPIPAWFVPLLKEAMQEKPDAFWLIPDSDGRCLSYQTYTRHWQYFYREMQRRAGAKTYRKRILVNPIGDDLTPYYLRHTYCTNLVYMRIPEVVAMRWMGHEDTDMVRKVYAHANNKKLLTQSVMDLNHYDPTQKTHHTPDHTLFISSQC